MDISLITKDRKSRLFAGSGALVSGQWCPQCECLGSIICLPRYIGHCLRISLEYLARVVQRVKLRPEGLMGIGCRCNDCGITGCCNTCCWAKPSVCNKVQIILQVETSKFLVQ